MKRDARIIAVEVAILDEIFDGINDLEYGQTEYRSSVVTWCYLFEKLSLV